MNTSRFYKIASLWFTLFYSLAIMIIMTMAYEQLRERSNIINDVREDWEFNYPIIDIQMVDVSQALLDDEYVFPSAVCPFGYEVLLTDTWMGTDNGCNCTGVFNTTYTPGRLDYTRGACDYNLTLEGCLTIE